MSCREKHFSDMIYAYELGLLPEESRNEFEIHLLECDSCFEELNKFKQEAFLLRNDPDVQESVKQFIEKDYIEVEKSTTQIIPIRSKKLWKTFIPIAAAAALFLVLVLKDWQFDISPSKEAIAAENRLAIMYFENLAEPDDSLQYGEIATNLLITDLAESQYMQVVSSQRLYDILKFLGQEGTKIIDRSIASEVAQKSGSRWLLTGSILQIEPHLILTSQIINASNGDVVATQKVTGKESQDIFSLVDQLSVEIKSDLALPAEAYEEPDPAVADVTTHSAEAYRYYLMGDEYSSKYYSDEAVKYYEKAIEYDSTFAMAYYALTTLKDASLISKVLQYSENVTQKEKLYIRSLEAMINNECDSSLGELYKIIKRYPDEKDAYYQLGVYYNRFQRFDSAIVFLYKAIELDPLFKMAYNQLAYIYNNIGDFEKSLRAIDKYIELAPDEANPLDTKAEIYGLNGMLDNAIDSYKRALTVKPNFYASLRKLCLMYIFEQEYDKADSCINILQGIESQKSEALKLRAFIPLFQGKFNEALKRFDDAIGASDIDYTINHYYKSRIYIEQKNWALALDETDKTVELYQATNPVSKAYYVYLGIQTLAESGDLNGTKNKLKDLKAHVEETNSMQYTYWYAVGAIDIAEGNYEKACLSFEKSRDHNDEFVVMYMLSKAYYLAERYDKAISGFEGIQHEYGAQRSYFPIMSTKLYYYLGLAYEKTGKYQKAVEQYEAFLNIWKNADEELESVEDAKERLAKLKSSS